jgi:hypothetical protein
VDGVAVVAVAVAEGGAEMRDEEEAELEAVAE